MILILIFVADNGDELWYEPDKDFITLEQWREQQLNQILEQ